VIFGLLTPSGTTVCVCALVLHAVIAASETPANNLCKADFFPKRRGLATASAELNFIRNPHIGDDRRHAGDTVFGQSLIEPAIHEFIHMGEIAQAETSRRTIPPCPCQKTQPAEAIVEFFCPVGFPERNARAVKGDHG
jgi:hypothetical protein